ncbi:MAG: S9 family peptidase [Phycisphaeraceae bacterium]|nr:S9 family peptidase [Phycisphaerales bacterium]QOJ18245.1 MAG: S9 family peptidase [Phycisphaeraceae bacterium]
MPAASRRTRPARPAKRRPIVADDLRRFVFVSDAQIAPDGSRLLMTRKHVGDKNKYVTNLWVASCGGGEPVQFTSGGKDRMGRWSPDGSRIAFIRSGDDGTTQIFTMSAAGGEAVALTSFPEGSIASFKWSPDGRSLAVSYRDTHPEWTKAAEKHRAENGASTPPRITEDVWYKLDGDGYFLDRRYRLYVVNARTGVHRLLSDRDTLGGFSYDWSPDSKSIALTANTNSNALLKAWNDRVFIINVASGRHREVPNLPQGPKSNVQWSPDGSRLAWGGRVGIDSEYSTENLRLYVCDPRTGDLSDLTGHEDYCLMAVTLSDTTDAVFGASFCWHPDGRRLVARIGWHGEGRVAMINVRPRRIAFVAQGRCEHSIGNFSADGSRLAVVRSSPTELAEAGYATFGAADIKVTLRTAFNRPWLSEVEVAAPESHWIKAADGTRVHVWVMRPPRAKGRTPGVLQIHGGPHAMYGWTFFHEFQTLAAAGYTVFYSNPRGSKGYGRDFCHAIHGSWGGKDWEDIQAVTTFMQQDRRVDARRLGVMGGSYGGYMTNWVIGHTRTFRGAITDRCVSNLISMWGNSDFPAQPDRYWPGNAWDRPEAVWNASPIKYMGKARTPTLIIHSEGDLRCNVEQAEQVFTILRTHNVPTRFVRYPQSTSHGMSRIGPPDLRLHRLSEILNWWAKYLK